MDISLLQGSNLLKTPAVSKLLSRANGKEPTIQANLTTQTTASSLDENIQCKSSLGGAYSICKFGLSFLPSHTKPFLLFWLSRTALPVIYKVRGRGRKVVTFADRSTHNFLCEYFEKDPLERLESEFFSSHNQLSPPHSNSPSNQAYRQIDSILLCKDLQEKAPNYLKSQLSTAMRIYKLRLHRNIILPPRGKVDLKCKMRRRLEQTTWTRYTNFLGTTLTFLSVHMQKRQLSMQVVQK